MRYGEETYNTSRVRIAEMARQLDLDERDRGLYLFDYGDEWCFYAILKEIRRDEQSDRPPEVVKEKGAPVVQYTVDKELRHR